MRKIWRNMGEIWSMKELWRNMKEIWRNIFPNFPNTWRGTRSEEKILWSTSRDDFPLIGGKADPKIPFLRLEEPIRGKDLVFPFKDTFPQNGRNGPFPRGRTFSRIGKGIPIRGKGPMGPHLKIPFRGTSEPSRGASRGRGHNSWDGS